MALSKDHVSRGEVLEGGAEGDRSGVLRRQDDVLARDGAVGEGRIEDGHGHLAVGRGQTAGYSALTMARTGPGTTTVSLACGAPGPKRGTRLRAVPEAQAAESGRVARSRGRPCPSPGPWFRAAGNLPEDEAGLELAVEADPAVDELEGGQVRFPAGLGAARLPRRRGRRPCSSGMSWKLRSGVYQQARRVVDDGGSVRTTTISSW